MKQRVMALCCAVGILLGCSACRLRADFSGADDNGNDGDTKPTVSRPALDDEMSKEAWRIYSSALAVEDGYTTYELAYESRKIATGETVLTKARMVRVETAEGVSLLLECTQGDTYSMGYYTNGMGYFNVEGKKYWMPAEEEQVMEHLGFSETEDLDASMFNEAIVIENEDGSAVVSCPFSGQTAVEYARLFFGNSVTQNNVLSAEAGVSVDAAGAPIAFTSAVSIRNSQYGTLTVESENRYLAVGEAVVLNPPADLDTYVAYTSIME